MIHGMGKKGKEVAVMLRPLLLLPPFYLLTPFTPTNAQIASMQIATGQSAEIYSRPEEINASRASALPTSNVGRSLCIISLATEAAALVQWCETSKQMKRVRQRMGAQTPSQMQVLSHEGLKG